MGLGSGVGVEVVEVEVEVVVEVGVELLWVGSGVVDVGVDELWVGSGVVVVDELWVGSGFDVELSATELLEAVELEVDELELLEAIELELDELELAVLDELLEVLSSGLSSPQPVRSAAVRSTAKIVVFFIKTSLKQIYSYYSTFSRICQEKPRGHKNHP